MKERQSMMPRSGSTTRRILLAFVLVMTFRTFQFFPGMSYVQESWFVLCFLVVLFVYPFWKMRSELRFSWFEIYLLVLMIADVSLAAWRAQQVFGQPLIYGILAQRGMALVALLLLLVNALRRRMVQLEDIEAALLYLAWGTLLLYCAMRLLLNPAHFVGYGHGFVLEPTPGTEASFLLPGTFILFGVLYYAILGMRTARSKYYLAAAVLLFASLGPTGRGSILCLAATLLYCLCRMRGLHRTIVATVKFGVIASVLAGVLYAIFPAVISTRAAGFSNAFTVVLSGSTTQDNSANARIFETLTALPYVQEHPLLGSGVISNQWQGGTGAVLGEYFHASDIGGIGVVFSYGILGLVLYFFQYQFAWSAAKRLPDFLHGPLLDATKAFVLYTALYSLETGMCVWNAETTLFFVALLGGIAAQATSSGYVDSASGRKCSLQKPALSA